MPPVPSLIGHRVLHVSAALGVLALVALIVTVLSPASPSLLGQGSSPYHVVTLDATSSGVTLRAGHTFLAVREAASWNGGVHTTFPLYAVNPSATGSALAQVPWWAYAFTPPPASGSFAISPQMIRQEPRYAQYNTLVNFTRGMWHYVFIPPTADQLLSFQPGQGLDNSYNASCVAFTVPQTPLTQGQSFTATARLQNTGRVPWTTATTPFSIRLAPSSSSANFGPTSVALPMTVPPTATVDFSLPLVAPTAVGTHTLNWQMQIPNMSPSFFGTPCTASVSIAGVCGNGRVESPEACDDGNVRDLDGCSRQCVVEWPFTCTGSPSVCTPFLPPSPIGDGPGGTSGATGGSGIPILPPPSVQPTMQGTAGGVPPAPLPFSSSLSPAPVPTGPITLHAVVVRGRTVDIEYSKTFNECAHIYLPYPESNFDQRINFICTTGTRLHASANMGDFGRVLNPGEQIKLCHGNNGNICSAFVTVTGIAGPADAAP